MICDSDLAESKSLKIDNLYSAKKSTRRDSLKHKAYVDNSIKNFYAFI